MSLGSVLGSIASGGYSLISPGSPNTSQYMGSNFQNLSNFGANPYSSPLASFMQNLPSYVPIQRQNISTTPLAYTGGTYQAKDMSKADLPQYDAMRSRVNTQYNQQQQQAQDALDRQFAAMGGGPGNGAQAKQTENLATGIAQQKGQDLEGINAQEAATRTELQQAEAQKEFQSQEAARGYGFAANQANVSNDLAAQQFNAGQFLNQQEFNRQMPLEQESLAMQGYGTLAGLNTQWDEAQAEANNNEFNKALSQWQATHSGGILGGGGILGTGLGA